MGSRALGKSLEQTEGGRRLATWDPGPTVLDRQQTPKLDRSVECRVEVTHGELLRGTERDQGREGGLGPCSS